MVLDRSRRRIRALEWFDTLETLLAHLDVNTGSTLNQHFVAVQVVVKLLVRLVLLADSDERLGPCACVGRDQRC